jgi:hypothetical protein
VRFDFEFANNATVRHNVTMNAKHQPVIRQKPAATAIAGGSLNAPFVVLLTRARSSDSSCRG